MSIGPGEGLLDWRGLDDETIWLPRDKGVRWFITNHDGVSTLTKLDRGESGKRSEIPGDCITFATLDYFESIVKNDELPRSMRDRMVGATGVARNEKGRTHDE